MNKPEKSRKKPATPPKAKGPRAPVGNQFWKMRSSHGRKPIFKNPEQLWNACCEYFEWTEANPLYEEKLFCYQGEVTKDTVQKMRAMTIGALCIFLDIARSTWQEYCKHKDFSAICADVEETIRSQKFQGAAADLLNASIIARDLGLAEKQEVSGEVTHKHTLSDEMRERLDAIYKQAASS